jgi:hypothetical protein
MTKKNQPTKKIVEKDFQRYHSIIKLSKEKE